jgi:hypothetical protein
MCESPLPGISDASELCFARVDRDRLCGPALLPAWCKFCCSSLANTCNHQTNLLGIKWCLGVDSVCSTLIAQDTGQFHHPRFPGAVPEASPSQPLSANILLDICVGFSW